MSAKPPSSSIFGVGEEQDNPVVFFDLTLGGEPLGRILIRLHAHALPLTCQNFHAFCIGSTKGAGGKPQGYKGSKFHRVIPNFMVQGGDFIHGDGTGSTSVYGSTKFKDEGFMYGHDEGVVSMANSGKDTNGCQFFITTSKAPHLDGKHVVFGKVVGGMDVVKKVERTRTRAERPVSDVVVKECGEM